jgi:glycine cleavage system H protein
MSNIPQDLRYAKTHEWVKLEAGTVLVGISDHAACELGDLVFAEAAAVGKLVKIGQLIGSVESVKTASDLYSPVAGEIVASNSVLSDQPELVNQDPYGSWFVRIKLNQPDLPADLLDAAGYKSLIGE